jgi:hypothetical protein
MQTPKSKKCPERVLDVYNCLLGLFLFASPWLFAFASEAARIDIWTTSAAIALVSLVALFWFSKWEELLNIILGTWLIVSPWVLGFAHTRAMHFSIGIGAVVVFLATIDLYLWYDRSTQDTTSATQQAEAFRR